MALRGLSRQKQTNTQTDMIINHFKRTILPKAA